MSQGGMLDYTSRPMREESSLRAYLPARTRQTRDKALSPLRTVDASSGRSFPPVGNLVATASHREVQYMTRFRVNCPSICNMLSERSGQAAFLADRGTSRFSRRLLNTTPQLADKKEWRDMSLKFLYIFGIL